MPRWCRTCGAYREPHEHPELLSLFDSALESVDHAPGRTRHDDAPSSKAGAVAVATRAGSQKARLLQAYRDAGSAGLTDEEAAAAADVPERSCWWKRCNELRESGLIRATGHMRAGGAGVQRIVCVAVS